MTEFACARTQKLGPTSVSSKSIHNFTHTWLSIVQYFHYFATTYHFIQIHSMEGHNGGVTGVQLQMNLAATSSYDATVTKFFV